MPVAVEPPEGLREASFVPDSGEGTEPPPCPLWLSPVVAAAPPSN